MGSFLRPDYLLAARKRFDKKELSASELKELEDKAIAEVVKMQKEVGLKGLTDGEYRYHRASSHEVWSLTTDHRIVDVTCIWPGDPAWKMRMKC